MSQSDTPDSTKGKGQEAPAAQEAQKDEAPSQPKNQLARRVEARFKALEEMLEKVAEDPAKQKRARAIMMALKGAHDTINLNNPRPGRMEAEHMMRWLESTQLLISDSGS